MMSDYTVGSDEAAKPVFAIPDNELEGYICPIW